MKRTRNPTLRVGSKGSPGTGNPLTLLGLLLDRDELDALREEDPALPEHSREIHNRQTDGLPGTVTDKDALRSVAAILRPARKG